jgi:hypothetical protein
MTNIFQILNITLFDAIRTVNRWLIINSRIIPWKITRQISFTPISK